MDILIPLAVSGLLVTAAVWDASTYRIPNAICAAIAGLFAVHAVLAPAPFPFDRIAVAGGVFLAGCALFARGVMGGGDVKLLTAAVLWIAPPLVPDHMAAVAMAGGALAIALVAARRLARNRCWSERLPTVLRDRAPVPYGIAIALATLAYFPFP